LRFEETDPLTLIATRNELGESVPPRSKKITRYVVVTLGLLLLVGVLVAVKFLQISSLMAMGKEMAQAGPPPEAVASAVAESRDWEGTLFAIGTVAGAKSVDVSNDAPGRVDRIRFESGAVVKKNQVLVELDTSVERAELASAKSRRGLAEVNAKRSRLLVAEKVAAQAQLDNDEAALRTASTEVAQNQAEIERKVVRAPFAGRLGIREVDVGQYLTPGTRLTKLEEVGAVYVDFTLPQEQLGRVKEGMAVRISSAAFANAPIDGAISAVSPAVDNQTRSLQLRATIPSEADRLRPGMFVDVTVVTPTKSKVVAVPAMAVVHAPYGDSLFVIEDKPSGSPGMTKTPDGKPVKVARQQFVRLGESRGDFVAILEGLKAGQQVVSAGAFKLRNGSPIVIDNSVKPEPKQNPRPENR
jgi:membrane fusion protein, multidrug efflux system